MRTRTAGFRGRYASWLRHRSWRTTWKITSPARPTRPSRASTGGGSTAVSARKASLATSRSTRPKASEGYCSSTPAARPDPCRSGPPFMSAEWRDLFQHALREADRLGIEVSVNLCSGWDAGGPWIGPDQAAKCFVQSQLRVAGAQTILGPAAATAGQCRRLPRRGLASVSRTVERSSGVPSRA